MTDPTQSAPRTTTTVRQVVADAHDNQYMLPRYAVGLPMFCVSLGLFANHVLKHHGESGNAELYWIGGVGIVGLLILPGIAEVLRAGISGVGGALVSLKKQKDAP